MNPVWSAVLLVLLRIGGAVGDSRHVDVFILGATPAGVAAAVSASRVSNGTAKIALVEATGYIGGMATAGGIGLRDFAVTPCCTMVEWAMANAQHYNTSDPVWQPDSAVGLASMWRLLRDTPGVTVYTNESYHSLEKRGVEIFSVTTDSFTWEAGRFIDATYEGLLMTAVASYTWGRESRKQYNESFAGVGARNPAFKAAVKGRYANGSLIPYVDGGETPEEGAGDKGVMGYSYRACVTNKQSNKAPFTAPPGYDADHFELMRRYITALNPPPVMHEIFGVLSYRGYPPKDKWDLCDAGGFAVTSDVVDETIAPYMNGSRAARAKVASDVRYYVQGFLHWLATSPDVPGKTQQSVLEYGYCKDEFPENDHLPPQLYVREGVRMVGDSVFTQNAWAARKVSDSVGIGAWGIDIHIVHRRVNPTTGDVYDEGFTNYNTGQHTFELPLSLILPRRSEVTNLLVPVTVSCTHVTWACLREEPTLWLLGMAAGSTAVLTPHGKPVQDVDLATLQAALAKQGVPLHV